LPALLKKRTVRGKTLSREGVGGEKKRGITTRLKKRIMRLYFKKKKESLLLHH